MEGPSLAPWARTMISQLFAVCKSGEIESLVMSYVMAGNTNPRSFFSFLEKELPARGIEVGVFIGDMTADNAIDNEGNPTFDDDDQDDPETI